MTLTIRHNRERDLQPLSHLLTDSEELALVNPNAGHPFDPLEWREKWLGDLHDESFYILDAGGAKWVSLPCESGRARKSGT